MIFVIQKLRTRVNSIFAMYQKKSRELYSSYGSSYATVFDLDTHRSVGKYTDLTNHAERFDATLKNRLGRFTKK